VRRVGRRSRRSLPFPSNDQLSVLRVMTIKLQSLAFSVQSVRSVFVRIHNLPESARAAVAVVVRRAPIRASTIEIRIGRIGRIKERIKA
jgi:hypothetical protein